MPKPWIGATEPFISSLINLHWEIGLYWTNNKHYVHNCSIIFRFCRHHEHRSSLSILPPLSHLIPNGLMVSFSELTVYLLRVLGGKFEQFLRLFVGALSVNTMDESLCKFYFQFGRVIDCVVVRDPLTNHSRCFGLWIFYFPLLPMNCQ